VLPAVGTGRIFQNQQMVLTVLTFACGLSVAFAGSRGLTPKDFDEAIDGKDAFIKFQAPW